MSAPISDWSARCQCGGTIELHNDRFGLAGRCASCGSAYTELPELYCISGQNQGSYAEWNRKPTIGEIPLKPKPTEDT